MPLANLYIGYARQDEPVTETRGDGKFFLSLRPGEMIAAVRAKNTPGLRSAYDKIRIRRSIEYPVTGVAVALRRDGDTLADLRVAFTGTNPRPVRLAGTEALCGGALDARVFKGLDDLVRDQIMAMKTTFTPGHYRRRVAGVLARRLVQTPVRKRRRLNWNQLYRHWPGLTRHIHCLKYGRSLLTTWTCPASSAGR